MTSMHTALDASIPVLTEIVTPSPSAAPLATAAATVAPPASAAAPAPQPEAITAAMLTESDWTTLQQQLTERVLYGLAERADAVLEQRMREALTQAVADAVGALSVQLQRGLHEALTDMVARAVVQELARVRANRPAP